MATSKATYDPCPTPNKVGYDRPSRALRAADGVKFMATIYQCACGRWHLTSKGN